jgi:dihydroxy-acid dehydratase
MKLWEPDIRPRDIITEKSISNAIKVCLAIGGSINSLYHFPAIAIEAWLREDVWGLFDKFSSEIPTLVKIIPNGEHDLEEYDRAGVLLY